MNRDGIKTCFALSSGEFPPRFCTPSSMARTSDGSSRSICGLQVRRTRYARLHARRRRGKSSGNQEEDGMAINLAALSCCNIVGARSRWGFNGWPACYRAASPHRRLCGPGASYIT